MPLELLSNIKGARSSEAVNELFKVITKAAPANEDDFTNERTIDAVTVEDLRSDIIIRCPEIEKELIRKNFPEERNGFLVVPKVIED